MVLGYAALHPTYGDSDRTNMLSVTLFSVLHQIQVTPVKNFEWTPEHARTKLNLCFIRLMVKRLAA
jgi:hypothetical protein